MGNSRLGRRLFVTLLIVAVWIATFNEIRIFPNVYAENTVQKIGSISNIPVVYDTFNNKSIRSSDLKIAFPEAKYALSSIGEEPISKLYETSCKDIYIDSDILNDLSQWEFIDVGDPVDNLVPSILIFDDQFHIIASAYDAQLQDTDYISFEGAISFDSAHYYTVLDQLVAERTQNLVYIEPTIVDFDSLVSEYSTWQTYHLDEDMYPELGIVGKTHTINWAYSYENVAINEEKLDSAKKSAVFYVDETYEGPFSDTYLSKVDGRRVISVPKQEDGYFKSTIFYFHDEDKNLVAYTHFHVPYVEAEHSLSLSDIDENTSYNVVSQIIANELTEIDSSQADDSQKSDKALELIETSLYQAARTVVEPVDDSVTIDTGLIYEASNKIDDILGEVQDDIEKGNISINRDIIKNVQVDIGDFQTSIGITFDRDLFGSDSDKVTVRSDGINISFDPKLAITSDESVTVRISKVSASASSMDSDGSTWRSQDGQLARGPLFLSTLMTSSPERKYQIEILGEEKQKLVVGLLSASNDSEMDSVFFQKNGVEEALGGKLNPVTGRLEVRTGDDGTYFVKENKKTFDDIQHVDAESKRAIEVLAAKGLINGKSSEAFDPNGSITRAEFAKIIVRALYLTDANADNTFTDVSDNAWYRTYVASSREAGLINGYDDGTFRPGNVITRQEMVKICSASLHEQKGYIYPLSPDQYVNRYADYVAEWVKKYVALADREGILVHLSSNEFQGNNSSTRKDAAVLLYRLFKKL